MALKEYKPTSAGRRFQVTMDYSDLTKKRPEKRLTATKKNTGGRNNVGRVTDVNNGGGNRQHYRMIDFKRKKLDIPGKVAAIEYDPNRSARIALIHYVDGDKAYILSPNGLKIGDSVISSLNAEIAIGNALPLSKIPLGTDIHNIELRPGAGAQMVRTAGGVAQIMAKEGVFAQVKMPSGEVRLISLDCKATVGQVGNLDHENVSLGKAGASRHRGRRPHVRGMAMNPVDHPHGGGEGRSKGGNHPQSRSGVPAKGYKTRKNKRTQWVIIKDRRK